MRTLKNGSRVVSITGFADGISCNNKNYFVLILKVNDLDCCPRSKLFLIGFAMSSKPNLEQFLRELIDDLNELWKNGIYSEKYGETVYPFIHEFLFDGKARPDQLLHSPYNAEEFCNSCHIKGRIVQKDRGHCRIFVHGEESIKLRKHHESLAVAEAIERKEIENIPFNGIKGKKPYYDIQYLDIVRQVPSFEPMHTFFQGFILRDFQSIQNFANRDLKCYINSSQRRLLQRRMDKIYINSNFKRKMDAFENVSSWKANQIADFFFNIGPIVFKSILDDDVYNHYLIQVYIISNFWVGGIDEEKIHFLKRLINDYLEEHKNLYPLTDQTSNLHQLNHIPERFIDIGPLMEKNAFDFESVNGEITSIITGPSCVLEKVITATEINLTVEMSDENLIEKSGPFKTNGAGKFLNSRIYFRSISRKNLTINSSSNFNSSTKEFYVRTSNDEFFEIKSIFTKTNSSTIYCDAYLIKSIKKLVATVDKNFKIGLPHIFIGKKEENTIVIEADLIIEKVLFLPIFSDGHSTFYDIREGFIVKQIHKYHN